MENTYHYQIITRALDYLRQNSEARPSLEEIAKAAGLSTYHFQRVFSEWVGISPKTYLEHLQLAHAKPLLKERMGNFLSAENAGLSGTGRLHDLLIKWEGVSPGEFANGNVAFYYDQSPTAFGSALLIVSHRGLAALAFTDENAQTALADYQKRWPKASFKHSPEHVAPYAQKLQTLSGEIPITLIGTPFQHQIWRALLALPEAHFTSYGDIANAIGSPKAARAVGTAVGRNPISWLVPCHRVIRQTGELGGYHWGLPRKEAMIAFESAWAENAKPS